MPVIWKWDRLEKEIDSGHPKSLIQNLFFASLEHCCFDVSAIFHDMFFTDHICSKCLVILNELKLFIVSHLLSLLGHSCEVVNNENPDTWEVLMQNIPIGPRFANNLTRC